MIGAILGIFVMLYLPFNYMNLIFLVHLLRRWYETIFWFNSRAGMHLLHYLVGLTFYPVVWLTLAGNESCNANPSSIYLWFFIAAMLGQSWCHFLLSRNLKRDELPRVWPFTIVVCPNFGLEVFLYFTLAMHAGCKITWLQFFFVFLNQAVSASQRQRHYRSSLFAMIPFIF
jgi:hypothetical protein